MSKYIRTEDTIYKLKDLQKVAYLRNYDFSEYSRANTIEELCDKFVCILPNEQPYWQLYRMFRTFEEIKNNHLNVIKTEPKAECYGAIWTSKGLIYIAKMNDKGELELC